MQTRRHIRLAFVMPIVGPARGAWFPLLNQEDDIELRVFALHETLAHRPGWISTAAKGYAVEVARTYALIRKRHFAGSSDADSSAHFIPVDLIKRLMRFKPDVAIVTNALKLLLVLPLRWFSGTKIILAAEDTPLFYSRIGRSRQILKAFVYRRADHFCAHSSQAVQLLQNLKVQCNRITFTPWAVDNDRFAQGARDADRQEIRRSLGLKGLTFITVGSLTPRKGIDHLIDAWHRLCHNVNPRPNLLVLGDGPQRLRLEAMAHEYGLDNVRFLGHVSQETLAGLYAAADVFILPTLEDIWGFVVSEAMAAGLPVLCSRYAGCSDDLIKPGFNGFVYDPLLSDDFDAILAKAVLCERELPQMGRYSIEVINRFSIKRSVRSLVNAVRRVAGSEVRQE